MALTAQQTPALTTDASRQQFYLAQLKASQPAWPEGLRYAVFDGLYTTHDFVAGICQTGLEMIGKLHHDAALKYLYQGEQK
ncbi:UNVERIFIED_CONTAM: IS4 family transposase, partial [Salmonella enterica subsp. enterica serovar Weltevreden]